MKRALLIDDAEIILKTYKHFLEICGYETILAKDGHDAIQKLEELSFKDEALDLILCDVYMPNIDGFGVLEYVKQSANWYETPFVIITANGNRLDERSARNFGAHDYLTKPITLDQLQNKLEALEAKFNKAA